MGDKTAVSHYELYGEDNAYDDPEFIHIEDLDTRSRLYEWQIKPHVHSHMFQCLFIQSGTADIGLDQAVKQVRGPCLITIPAGTVHGFSFEPETAGWVLTVSQQVLIDSRYRESFELLTPLFEKPLNIELEHDEKESQFLGVLLAKMHHEFQWTDIGRTFMLEWLLRVLLMSLRRQVQLNPSSGADKHSGAFAAFRQLVEEHYDQHWPVSHYAQLLALSPASLNRLCQRLTGKGACKLIHERLALEAKRHLMYTSATVSVIAYELGFGDPAYFGRFFKRVVGQTPKAYRDLKQATVIKARSA